MLNKSEAKFGLEEIVARMRAGARRVGGSLTSDEMAGTGRTVKGTPTEFQPIVLQPLFEPRADNHYHINDLLKYHDRAFIQNAYRAILKRGPDATGFRDFIDALRTGRMNKVDVLARLRYSPEGRAKQVTVDGLLFPAGFRLLYRIPVIGYLLNVLVGIARLPNSLRHEQQFQAHVLAQQEIIAEHTNYLTETLRSFRSDTAALYAEFQKEQSVAKQDRDELLQRITGVHERLQGDLFAKLSELNHIFEKTLESRFDQFQERFDNTLRAEQSARQRGMEQLTTAIGAEQRARETGLHELSLALGREQHAREEAFNTLSAGLNEKLSGLSETHKGEITSLAAQFHAEVQKLYQKQQEARTELVVQGARVARLLESFQDVPADRPKSQPPEVVFEADHALDAFYLSLEDHFRGNRAEIKERLRVYLPWIARAGAGGDHMPLLDVGCGRGEWLELLRDEGLRATGVDTNSVLAQQCRELGLEVTEADLVRHLRSLPDRSLGAITGFHIIEHLPIETLIKFLDESVRVLKPGGLLIFETPNPQNVLVGTCNFYFDPTHRNPLPSPISKFLLESRGYTNVEVLNLNPSDELPVTGDSDLARRFNQYFYGPMDYAVTGVRP